MDVRCKFCGEPWDTDELHYVEGWIDDSRYGMLPFDEARRRFYAQGCGVFDGGDAKCGRGDGGNETPLRAMIEVAQDMLGDDIDGLAATLEDFGVT